MVDTATAGQPIPKALVDGFQSGTWIWTPEIDNTNTPVETIAFRKTYTSPAGKSSSSALVLITADNLFTLFVNGRFVGASPNETEIWKNAMLFNVALEPVSNVFAVIGTNSYDPVTHAAGLLATSEITFSDGTTNLLQTDGLWLASKESPENFASPSFDDSQWDKAALVAPYGKGPWASQVIMPTGPIPPVTTLSISATTTMYVLITGFFSRIPCV